MCENRPIQDSLNSTPRHNASERFQPAWRRRHTSAEDRAALFTNRPSLLAVIGAYIGIPAVLNFWAPVGFIVAWLVAYTIACGSSVVLVGALPIRTVNQIWVVLVGIVMATIPVSLVVWGDVFEFQAVLIAVAVVYLASDASVVPYMPTHNWRVGALINMATTMAVIGLFGTRIIALSLAIVTYSLVTAGDRAMTLTADLEARRATAEDESTRDGLTGVLNRRGVVRVLEGMQRRSATAVMVDADRFKAINDTWGHVAGDQVLTYVARGLEERLGTAWSIGRLGGDEFVAIAAGNHPAPEELVDPLAVSFVLHARPVSLMVNLSGGTSHVPSVEDADHVLGELTYALRAAKREEANRLVHLDGDLREQFHRATEVTAGVDARFGEGHFVALAQPVVRGPARAASGTSARADAHKIVGFELLARWERSDGSTIGPHDFLPVLRQNGALASLGNLMLDHAVGFAADVAAAATNEVPFVSLNIDPSQLLSADFAPQVARALASSGVDASQLVVEITESEALYQVDGWEGFAADLRALGVGLAIDDFGVGYSTIERVTDLPVTHIKLDRVFSSSTFDPIGQLTTGVVGFFKSSGMTVIAEGVENSEQLRRLTEAGADLFQGWLFGYPEPLPVALEQFATQAGPSEVAPTIGGGTSPV